MSSALKSRLERGLLGYLVLTYRGLYMILLALYVGPSVLASTMVWNEVIAGI
jgi:hypothetical protein